jgi:methyl-accepting chemotaxis protein
VSASNLDRIQVARPAGLRRLDLFGPIPFQLAAIAYLSWIGEALSIEVGALLVAFVGSSLVGGWILAHRAIDRTPWLDAAGAGGDDAASVAASRNALSAVQSLPFDRQRSSFLLGLVPILVAPPLLWLLGDGGWLELSRMRSLALACGVAAATTSTLNLFATRRCLEPLRVGIIASPAGSKAWAEREAPRSLSGRIRYAAIVPAIASLVMLLDVASHSERRAAEEAALAWASSAVESLASGERETRLSERVEKRLPAELVRPVPIRAFEFTQDTLDDAAHVGLSAAFLAQLDRGLVNNASHARIAPRNGADIGAYRRLVDGTVLVVGISRADLVAGSRVLGGGVLVVAMGMGLFSILLGIVVSRDFGDAFEALQREADRLAAGDLSAGALDPSGDEFGALARSMSVVRESVRATVDRTAHAAENVEETVAGLTKTLEGIAGSSLEQSQQVAEANRLMRAINEQFGEASQSANALSLTIDESSNSVLELSVGGDELNETATVLTSKVDAVSDSLEQMVRSVKQVSATTERLSEASDETSSSMEEMASAMRAVDTSAETTAKLSRDVVEKAELGQAKVVQTIEGMEAIREATDAAERVIRGLGARTNEIGGILDVIEDVADETNLLALNAAIIAAQAGEQGKAFSVVADEIKELADRVLASTKEIGGLIRSVQEESENAVGAIEAGSASVMSGVDLSAEAGRTLEEITDASRESGLRITKIVNSVREQTKAASHVVELMERVRDSADEIGAAGAEQDRGNEVVYRSALTMREVAQQVRRTTEEQSTGLGRIRENVVGVRAAVEQISGSLREQSEACNEVTGFLERVSAGSRANEEAAEAVQEAMRELARYAEGIREDVERFRC